MECVIINLLLVLVGIIEYYNNKWLIPHKRSTFYIGSLSKAVTNSSLQLISLSIGSTTSGALKSYISTQYLQGGESEIHAAWRE